MDLSKLYIGMYYEVHNILSVSHDQSHVPYSISTHGVRVWTTDVSKFVQAATPAAPLDV